MSQVILDLCSDANVPPNNTWERMGSLALQWSPIQLRMANLHKIIRMGCLYGVMLDIEGASELV